MSANHASSRPNLRGHKIDTTPLARVTFRGHNTLMTQTNNEIEVVLDGPNGPEVRYPTGTDVEDVEAEIPEGWEVDWETTPADSAGGRKASPLRELAQLYFGCSDDDLDYEGWGDVFADLATHLKTIGEDIYGADWSEADEGCQITAPIARIDRIKAAIESFDGPVYCEVSSAS